MIEFLLLKCSEISIFFPFFCTIQWALITNTPKGSLALDFMQEYPDKGSEKFAFFTENSDPMALVKDALLFTCTSERCYELLEHSTGINYATLQTMENGVACTIFKNYVNFLFQGFIFLIFFLSICIN